MNLKQINDKITEEGRKISDLGDRLMAGENVYEELKGCKNTLESLKTLRDMTMDEDAKALRAAETRKNDMMLSDMLKSREYARAFAYAIRNGITVRNGMGNEKCKPLFDALTIGGGTTPGEDGGFLVPEDVQNAIIETQRELNPLKELFTVESVTSQSGYRVLDTAPSIPMAKISEMGQIGSTEQPKFARIPYSLDKYAEILPISAELESDEVAGLFAYLGSFIAKRVTITENSILMALLNTLSGSAIAAGKELSGIKSALNKELDPVIAAGAVIVTNQDGFDVLDNMDDQTGRPLLQTNPLNGTPHMANGKEVHVLSNNVLKSTSGSAPIFIGNFKQYATLFERNPVEVVSTNIGGTAFATDSVNVRYTKRMDARVFDSAAVVMHTITI